MRVASRSAEWNYLFGAVLFRLGEIEKAVLYFGIATRQQPGNPQYQTAYESAEALRSRNRRSRFSVAAPADISPFFALSGRFFARLCS